MNKISRGEIPEGAKRATDGKSTVSKVLNNSRARLLLSESLRALSQERMHMLRSVTPILTS